MVASSLLAAPQHALCRVVLMMSGREALNCALCGLWSCNRLRQGIMDTPRGQATYGTVDVFRDRLEIHGHGRLVRQIRGTAIAHCL